MHTGVLTIDAYSCTYNQCIQLYLQSMHTVVLTIKSTALLEVEVMRILLEGSWRNTCSTASTKVMVLPVPDSYKKDKMLLT